MDTYIFDLLQSAANTPEHEIETILKKAARCEGLTHTEAAALLAVTDDNHINHIYEIAGQIKEHIYGERIVLFAPLYISDYCVNHCVYCGFKNDNDRPRRRLTLEEIKTEVKILEKMGHKRLAVEAGEDPANCPLNYILECIDTIYKSSDIRRVNVNIAAMETSDYRRLKDAQIGTYILFQETYHRPAYKKFHLGGPKADFDYHFSAFDRAMDAKIDDVGAGVLFGLYDYRYEVLALMLHNEHLEKNFGVGFHTISVPRIRSTGTNNKYPYAVSDRDFLKLVAILRMAVPFTGMIVSTRETAKMRKQLIKNGVSQMSAGSSAAVGGYSVSSCEKHSASQFSLADHRDAKEIFYWLMEEGVLPSFCTACYRKGRVGDRFMDLAKTGDIKNVCLPNGIITLKEYALDYGDDRFKTLASNLINKNLANLDTKTHDTVISKLEQLEHGKRDLFI